MRSAIPIFLATLAFAAQRRAQGTGLMTKLISAAVCSSKETSAANTDRLAKRLNLTDRQRTGAEGPGRGFCVCRHNRRIGRYALTKLVFYDAGPNDFLPKRWRRSGLPAFTVEPKLQAFYDSLDENRRKPSTSAGASAAYSTRWRKK